MPATVFGDTSGYFALAAESDDHHAEAERLLRRATADRLQLYTTNFVLAETHALFLHRLKSSRGAASARAVALRTVERLYQSTRQRNALIRVTSADEMAAFALLAQFADQDFTFTDATSFVVMRRLGISVAFSFDEDFAKAGFIDVRHVLSA
jgi:predicted nucleic acid-binding protein